jgi:prepilin-type N-terminal cleavage/methylation domain-containing protein
MKAQFSNEKGFSLLELLVVIAVLAILAALLFPALAKAKVSTKEAVCVNNLKQINYGVRMYADDSGDRLPLVGIPRVGADGDGVWRTYRHLVQSYVGIKGPATEHDKIFTCPSDTFSVGFDDHGPVRGGPAHASGTAPDFTSYLFSGFNSKTNRDAPGIAGDHLSAIVEPARIVLVGEASAFVGFSWHRPSKELLLPDALNELSYVDGHVNFVKIYWSGSGLESGSASYYNPQSPMATNGVRNELLSRG